MTSEIQNVNYETFEEYLQKNDFEKIKCDDCGDSIVSYIAFATSVLCVKCMKKEYEENKIIQKPKDEICRFCEMTNCECIIIKSKSVEIKLTDSILFKSDMTKNKVKEYLRNKMSVEDLGDCLFVKKIGKFKTFKIEFRSGSPNADIIYVSQIKDDENNTINKEIFY